ncbi:hypothetical protein B0E37_00480 [Streptomyces sp. MH192]|nr:hypothetical protein [Streptomyces sp. MH192]
MGADLDERVAAEAEQAREALGEADRAEQVLRQFPATDASGDRLAGGVGDPRDARGGEAHGAGRPAQRLGRAGHQRGVEGVRDGQLPYEDVPFGEQGAGRVGLLPGAGQDEPAGAVDGGHREGGEALGHRADHLGGSGAGEHRALAGLFVHEPAADRRQGQGVLQRHDPGHAGGGVGPDAVAEHRGRPYAEGRPQLGEGQFEGHQGGLAVTGAGEPLRAGPVGEEQVRQGQTEVGAQDGVGPVEGAGEAAVGLVEAPAHAGVLGSLTAEQEGDPGRGAGAYAVADEGGRGVAAHQGVEGGVQFPGGAAGEDGPVGEAGAAGVGGAAQGGEVGLGVGGEVGAPVGGQGGEGGGGVGGEAQGVHGALGRGGVVPGRLGGAFEDEVRGGAAEPEGADGGPGEARPRGVRERGEPGGDVECRAGHEVAVGGAQVQGRRHLAVAYDEGRLDQSGDARGRLQVSDVGLDRPDEARLPRRPVAAVDGGQGLPLDGVAERGPGAVRLHVVDLAGGEAGPVQGAFADRPLGRTARRRQAVAPAAVAGGGAPDHGVDAVALGQCPGEGLEQDEARALPAHVPVRRVVEGAAAAVRREHAARREGHGQAGGEHEVDPAREGRVALPAAQALAGEVDGVEGGGAGRVEGEAGPAQVERVGKAVGGDGVGVAGGRVHVDVLGAGHLQRRVVVAADADEDAGGGAGEAGRVESGVVQGLAGHFEEQPLLRVGAGGLACRHAEEAGVELVDAVEESAVRGGVDPGGVPALPGHLGDRVAAVHEEPPEAVRVGGAGEAAADPDDRDGLVGAGRGGRGGWRGRDGRRAGHGGRGALGCRAGRGGREALGCRADVAGERPYRRVLEDRAGGEGAAGQRAEFGHELDGLPGVQAERGQRAGGVDRRRRQPQTVPDAPDQPLLDRLGAVRHGGGRGGRRRGVRGALRVEEQGEQRLHPWPDEQFAAGDAHAEPSLQLAHGGQQRRVVEVQFGERPPGDVRGVVRRGDPGQGLGDRLDHALSAALGGQPGEPVRARHRVRGGRLVPGDARRHHRQPQVEEVPPARPALDLAAGRLVRRRASEEEDGVRGDLVRLGDGGAQPGQQRGRVLDAPALDLVGEDHPLGAVHLDGEDRAAARAQPGVGAFRRQLDVVRVVVAALHDDDVLGAADDVQLALAQEAEVARAEPGGVLLPLDTGAEGLLGGVGAAPVAVGDAAPGEPDLPDAVARGDPSPGVRVDEGDVHAVHGRTASDDLGRRAVPRGGGGPDGAGAQVAGGEGAEDGGPVGPDAGHHQGGLGEAVAGQEGLLPEAVGGEAVGEAPQGVGAHRLGPVQREPPVAEVQPLALLLGDPADAGLEAEVGGDAGGGAGAGQGLQPQQRAPDEGHGRHQVGREAAVQRGEDASDEAHVVVRRQPGDHARAGVVLQPAVDRAEVVQQVVVADHDALGGRGRARGVLEERRSPPAGAGVPPFLGAGGVGAAGHQQAQAAEAERGEVLGTAVQETGDLRGGQGVCGPRVPGDRGEAGHGLAEAPGVRRVRGDGDGPRVQAAEEGGDVVEPRRVQQQDRLPGQVLALEAGGHRADAQVELPVGERLAAVRARVVGGREEAVGEGVRAVLAVVSQEPGNRRRFRAPPVRAGRALVHVRLRHLPGRARAGRAAPAVPDSRR